MPTMKKVPHTKLAAKTALDQIVRHAYQAASQAQLLQDGFSKEAMASLRKDVEAIIKATYEYSAYSYILEDLK